MKSFPGNKYLILLSRLILGVVFIIASIDKIADPAAFAASIQAYQLFPVALVNLAALVMAWIELLCGVFLLGGVLVRGSSAIVSLLLAVFIAAMLSAMARGLVIDCGCFGKGHETPLGWLRVLEDAGMLLLGLYLVRFPVPAISTGNAPVSARPD